MTGEGDSSYDTPPHATQARQHDHTTTRCHLSRKVALPCLPASKRPGLAKAVTGRMSAVLRGTSLHPGRCSGVAFTLNGPRSGPGRTPRLSTPGPLPVTFLARSWLVLRSSINPVQ